MDRVQKNYVYMAQGVLDVFDGRKPLWENIPVLAGCVVRVAGLCGDINRAVKEQGENSSTGYTTAKDQARTDLEDCLFVTGSRLKAYAVVEHDPVAEALVRFSRSALDNMSLASLLTCARIVVDSCVAHGDKLQADYMVTDAEVVVLQELIDRVATLNAHRNTVNGQRVETTVRLATLLSRLRSEIKLLDTLVDGYVTDEEFLTVYFAVRRIHDVRGGSSSNKKG